jgi:hypothetical protein
MLLFLADFSSKLAKNTDFFCLMYSNLLRQTNNNTRLCGGYATPLATPYYRHTRTHRTAAHIAQIGNYKRGASFTTPLCNEKLRGGVHILDTIIKEGAKTDTHHTGSNELLPPFSRGLISSPPSFKGSGALPPHRTHSKQRRFNEPRYQ